MKEKTKSLGFTLVELMVVVAVIGILASIIYANFGSARGASRDDIRKSSLEEVRLALELYKAQYGRYPSNCRNDTAWAGTNHTIHGASCTPQNYINGLVPDFLPALPWEASDSTNQGYLYKVDSSGQGYKFMAWRSVEVKFLSNYSDEYARCPSQCTGTNCGCSGVLQTDTYAVYSSPFNSNVNDPVGW